MTVKEALDVVLYSDRRDWSDFMNAADALRGTQYQTEYEIASNCAKVGYHREECAHDY